MADLDMNRILAPSDVSRRLGRDNGQYSQAYKYKVIWLKQVRLLYSSLSHVITIFFWWEVGQHY
jgi:hypothetical protein